MTEPNLLNGSSLVTRLAVFKQVCPFWGLTVQLGECGQLWAEAKNSQEKKTIRGRKKKVSGGTEQPSLKEKNAERCKTKAQEGQYSRAVQALVSCGLAEYSPESLAVMQQKHPAPRRPQPPPPASVMPPRAFNTVEVAAAALSFPKGSGAGPSNHCCAHHAHNEGTTLKYISLNPSG